MEAVCLVVCICVGFSTGVVRRAGAAAAATAA